MIVENFKIFLKEKEFKVPSFHPYFEEALNYILAAGGKHFRAQLILELVQAKKPELLEEAQNIAFAVEIFHSYSLIHDDLPSMDNADLRRGKLTLHKKYDEVTAILVGDALNTQAFYEISSSAFPADLKIEIIKSLSYNGGIHGMVLGQALDCYFENQSLKLEELEFLHMKKTGALIASSLEIGALLSDFSKEEARKFYEAGLKLGLAFQIYDDLLDLLSSEEESGKTVNHDENKNTFVKVMSQEEAQAAKDKLLQEAIAELKILDENIAARISKLISKYL